MPGHQSNTKERSSRPIVVKADDHVFKPHPVLVRDLRGKEDQFTLEANGFKFMKHATKLTPEELRQGDPKRPAYSSELEELLKEV